MIVIEREEIKKDPVFRKLHEHIKENHQVAPHTRKVLLEHKHVKDFCEEARFYVQLGGEDRAAVRPIYFHYDISSWYKHPDQVVMRVESIGLYEDFLEYETARLKGIHSTNESTGGNLN